MKMVTGTLSAMAASGSLFTHFSRLRTDLVMTVSPTLQAWVKEKNV